jgi:hypothetical protein
MVRHGGGWPVGDDVETPGHRADAQKKRDAARSRLR